MSLPATFTAALACRTHSENERYESIFYSAEPSEALERGLWWTVFNDTVLNDLEHQAMLSNQNVHAAVARLKQARALNQSAQAGLFPTVGAGFSPTRQRSSPASQSDRGSASQQTLWRAQAGISYEVDLFGRVASTVDAAQAEAGRSEAFAVFAAKAILQTPGPSMNRTWRSIASRCLHAIATWRLGR